MAEMESTAIIWFRNDLRLSDNAALNAAQRHKSIIPLFIYDETLKAELGGARKWWLHHAINVLGQNISELGNDLILKSGNEYDTLQSVIEQTCAKAVYWNRRYEPSRIKIDKAIKNDLKNQGVSVESFAGHLLHEPTQLMNKSGTPFKVFTPFWRTLESQVVESSPIPKPDSLPPAANKIESDQLDDWKLLPTNPNWATSIGQRFTPGENAAQSLLGDFLQNKVDRYKEKRDFPAVENTSYLSPYLTFGEISPRQIWSESQTFEGGQSFRRQLGWRDFSYYLLIHNPELKFKNFNDNFDTFQWSHSEELFEKWKKGQTGYPIIDAGMRELWQTGYMHNRVRMVVASFLTKHLLIDWREGEKWFWDTLVDADPANNAASWQWVAGSGADASPYYRIFNPIIQGQKFDPEGRYVKQYVPELANLAAKYIHTPWEAPEHVTLEAGIELGTTYPKPIVDHSFARNRALDAYQRMKEIA